MDNPKIVRKKDMSVETLRGAAIILVVMGHVIGSTAEGGMQVAEDSFLRHLYFTFEYLRMPLFTVISGWVYALHPAALTDLKSFFIKKVRRIILPLIFVGASYFILQYLIPGTNKKGNLADIWQILVFPYTLYWYLPSLFLVFMVISVVDAYQKMSSFTGWLVVFILALLLLLFRDYLIPESWPNYFSYKGAIYLLPFFIIGIGIKRFKEIFTNRYLLISLLIILVVSLTLQQLAWYKIIGFNLSKSGGIGLLIGLAGTILLFRVHLQAKWLIWIGGYAYTIYLFHAFGTAGGRILTKATGMHATVVVFFVSLLAGMFIPIVAEMVLDRFKLTRMLFLGRSYHKKQKDD
jgi:peptidoglycan/LPS O-acetylase OafA/YrhL